MPRVSWPPSIAQSPIPGVGMEREKGKADFDSMFYSLAQIDPSHSNTYLPPTF